MANLATQRAAIEKAAMQIHSGTPVDSAVETALKAMNTGDVSTINAPTAAGQTITHSDNNQYVKLTGLTAATTINMAAGSELAIGAEITIDVVQGGTGRNVVLGTGIVGDDLTGVANDRDVLILKYVATDTWVCVSNYKTVNAA